METLKFKEIIFKKESQNPILVMENGDEKKYHETLQYFGGLFVPSGFYTDAEWSFEIKRTDIFLKNVFIEFKKMPWYKRILKPMPFTSFTNYDDSFYKVKY